MTSSALHIVGAGAVTCLGLTLPSSSAAYFCDLSFFEKHPYMIDKSGEQPIVARIRYPEHAGSNPARLMELITPAAIEALAPIAGITSIAKLGLIVALPKERPGLSPVAERDISDMLY